jgi:hypothetical protein
MEQLGINDLASRFHDAASRHRTARILLHRRIARFQIVGSKPRDAR